MRNAEMIIKRIEDAGAVYIDQRAKWPFMCGVAYAEIRELCAALREYSHEGAFAIEYAGIELSVNGTYAPEYEATQWVPGEPESFEASEVYLRGLNVRNLFTDEQMQEIEELVIEKIHQINAELEIERFESRRAAA